MHNCLASALVLLLARNFDPPKLSRLILTDAAVFTKYCPHSELKEVSLILQRFLFAFFLPRAFLDLLSFACSYSMIKTHEDAISSE